MTTPSLGYWGRVLGTVVGVLAVTAAATPDPDPDQRSIWSGVYSPDQAERGRATFATACAMCHSADLAGRGAIPALRGEPFTANRHGRSVGELFDLIRTTMPPAQPESLSAEAYADVVAYILSQNAFPAGDAELEGQPEVLDRIVFDERVTAGD